jgi:hypothetical protein
MVSHGEAGLLVEKLLLMAGNEKAIKQMGEVNRHYALKNLDTENLKMNLLEIIGR